jgi:hypothetical protein
MDFIALSNSLSSVTLVLALVSVSLVILAPNVAKQFLDKLISMFDIDGLKANFKKYQAREERRLYWREFYKNNPDKDKYRRNKK